MSADSQRRILVLNKSDLLPDPSWQGVSGIAVSCATGAGLDALRAAIRDLVLHGGSMTGDHLVAINARHKSCFERMTSRLQAAREAMIEKKAPEFIALDLREAMQALGEVIGLVDSEQVLDAIFAQFCIGK